MKPVHVFNVIPSLPAALEGLRQLAYNLRWAWNHDTIELFRRLDSDLWESTGHNPVLMLGTIDQAQLEAAAKDESFLAQLDRLVREMASYLSAESTWYRRTYASDRRAAGGLLLGRIRIDGVPVHICGRAGRAGRRSSEVGQQSGCAAGGRRPAVPARVLSSIPQRRGMAAGVVRRQRFSDPSRSPANAAPTAVP